MPVFTELASRLDRLSFSCGVPALDSYLRERARLDVKRGICAVHVLAEGDVIMGYYTLSPFTMQLASLPAGLAKKYPKNLLLPCWLIGRLAVDVKFQRQKIGQRLLADALKNTLVLSKIAGGYCVVVDAKNEEVKPFYEKYGFKPIIGDELRLYLSLAALEADAPKAKK
jgi:GNAT superfamily N-acetyltransferase